MASPADWYPDPSRPGRLRYWDGATWTHWVSESGETRSDPVNPLSYPPPAPTQERRRGHAGGQTRAQRASSADLLARGGIGLAAIAGVVAVVSLGKTLVSQQTILFASGERTIEVGPGVWAAAVAAVLLALAAAFPWPWARFAGVGLSGLLGLSLGFSVVGSRASDRFPSSGPDVELGSGGVILAVATLIALLGTAIALVGLAWLASETRRGRTLPGLAIASLVLGIVGIVLPVTQTLAVAFGSYGLGGFGSREERTEGGRGMALAGFVLGLCGIAIWWLIVVFAMFLAQPSPTE